ncbi:MAG: hypothetical protein QOH92_3348 [Chloroflexota bacterium]|jgi:hypothetical protein|nr:hypothetical protein [Chloroflexota bacterium]
MAVISGPVLGHPWLVIGVMVLTVAACRPSTSTVSPAPSDAMAVLPCQDVIASAAAPPSESSVILDAVALPTGRALQANKSNDSDPSAKLFAKDGLLIRRGASFDLLVPEQWRGRLLVGWGSPGKPTTHLRVSGCRPTQRMPSSSRWDLNDDWLVYPGGYSVSQAACVSVLVRAGQSEQTVRIGVGASCPGQGPPPSPA